MGKAWIKGTVEIDWRKHARILPVIVPVASAEFGWRGIKMQKMLALAVGLGVFFLLHAVLASRSSRQGSTGGVRLEDRSGDPEAVGDRMEQESGLLMGNQGIDCGRVKVRGNPRSATECALKAQAAGKPFRIRYDIMGIDSAVAGGIVRTPAGQLWALSFDGDPAGQGGTSDSRQVLGKSQCPQPVYLWVNPKGRINCFQQQLSGPRSVMSPNSEPY